MNILGFIPARGGSKGIPGKNLKLLAGKPLIEYTIDACRESGVTSRLIVSTDSVEIAHFAQHKKVEIPFLRPADLSDDHALMIDVVRHALFFFQQKENYNPDAVLLLQPTSPLRTSAHICEAVESFVESRADTVVSVMQVPHNMTPESIYTSADGVLHSYLTGEKIYDRNRKPKYFARNGPSILISSVQNILENRSFYGSKIVPYFMLEEDSIDIDTPFEFDLAELLIQKRN